MTTPRDAESAQGAELARIWAEALEANPEMSISEIATVSGDDVVADLRALADQFDARDAEITRLRAESEGRLSAYSSWSPRNEKIGFAL